MQQSYFRVGITNRLGSLHGIVQDEKWRSGTSNTTKMVKFFLQSLFSVLLPSALFTSIFCHILTTSFLEFSVMDILNYGHCCLIRWDVWDYVRVSKYVSMPSISSIWVQSWFHHHLWWYTFLLHNHWSCQPHTSLFKQPPLPSFISILS